MTRKTKKKKKIFILVLLSEKCFTKLIFKNKAQMQRLLLGGMAVSTFIFRSS